MHMSKGSMRWYGVEWRETPAITVVARNYRGEKKLYISAHGADFALFYWNGFLRKLVRLEKPSKKKLCDRQFIKLPNAAIAIVSGRYCI